jgi:hypothetical protein
MRKLLGVISLFAALGVFLAGSVPSAVSAGVAPAVADCSQHGKLTRHYSASELQNSLATMPTDVKEYSSCPNVIQQALLAELGSVHGGGGSGGSSFLPGWVIAVLVVLVLAGAAAGAMAVRNRRQES